MFELAREVDPRAITPVWNLWTVYLQRLRWPHRAEEMAKTLVEFTPDFGEVAEAIRKASEAAKRDMKEVAVSKGTIPHEVIGEHGGGRVLLRPASPGTGIIAGGGVRAVVEAAGVRDVLAKSLGSNNHANVVIATLKALTMLRDRDEVFRMRGIKQGEGQGENRRCVYTI